MEITNLLTIDVEDYFQVSAFEKISPIASWDARECRVERNTDRILELLAAHEQTATFFVLGWIARRYPALVRRLAGAGHEIASHGFNHQRVYNMPRAAFREDVRGSKALLEDISGQPVYGYRAPSYSISSGCAWAFDELCDAGYRYDSSIFPIKHDLYGMADWPRFAGYTVRTAQGDWRPSALPGLDGPSLRELPISTLCLAKRNVPIAGGGYFRLFPYALSRAGLRRINRTEGEPFIFYLHPWELDPEQPRLRGAGPKSCFRHYLNLHKTERRFGRLLEDFHFAAVREVFPDTCAQEQTGCAPVFASASQRPNAGRTEGHLPETS